MYLEKIDSPADLKKLDRWDVSHQAYAHKIVTGRRDRFPTLRQERGLSGLTTEGIQAAAEALVKVRRLEPRRGESAA